MAESRTIYKVKRFLSTLVQFGNDISSETGDRVKELIFNLVVRTKPSYVTIKIQTIIIGRRETSIVYHIWPTIYI